MQRPTRRARHDRRTTAATQLPRIDHAETRSLAEKSAMIGQSITLSGTLECLASGTLTGLYISEGVAIKELTRSKHLLQGSLRRGIRSLASGVSLPWDACLLVSASSASGSQTLLSLLNSRLSKHFPTATQATFQMFDTIRCETMIRTDDNMCDQRRDSSCASGSIPASFAGCRHGASGHSLRVTVIISSH
jgi:hypothetical protein